MCNFIEKTFYAHFNPCSFHPFKLRLSRFDAPIYRHGHTFEFLFLIEKVYRTVHVLIFGLYFDCGKIASARSSIYHSFEYMSPFASQTQ